MKVMNIEKLIELEGVGGKISVRYTVVRDGQCKPSVSNDVIATGTLYLPVEPGSAELAKELRFGKLLKLMGGRTTSYWGFPKGDWHYRTISFHAATWHEVFTACENEIIKEINKLKDKLDERRKALELAELPPESTET